MIRNLQVQVRVGLSGFALGLFGSVSGRMRNIVVSVIVVMAMVISVPLLLNGKRSGVLLRFFGLYNGGPAGI